MPNEIPPCPQCSEPYAYEQGALLICPMCAHEWSADAETVVEARPQVHDAFGNVLADGDTVTVVKDLKVKGSSSVLKVGTKVKNITLATGYDGHDIDCKIPGFGLMQLKSAYVKKS